MPVIKCSPVFLLAMLLPRAGFSRIEALLFVILVWGLGIAVNVFTTRWLFDSARVYFIRGLGYFTRTVR